MEPQTTPQEPLNNPPQSEVPTPSEQPQQPMAVTPLKKKSKMKFIVIGAAAALLLGGGSAAAYFGVVVPNKPENVFKVALENTFSQKSGTYEGTVDVSDESAGLFGEVKVDVSGEIAENAISNKTTLNILGMSVPVEVRFVENKAYVKFDDLNAVSEALTSFLSEAASGVNAVLRDAEGQWYYIDQAALDKLPQSEDEATQSVDCVAESLNMNASEQLDTFKKFFEQNEFVTVASSESDDVDGKSATKMELAIDKEKLKAFANALAEEQKSKLPEGCDSSDLPSVDDVFKGLDEQNISDTSLTIWVTKDDKMIKKFEFGAKADKTEIKATFVLDFKSVTIQAPEGAESIETLINEVTEVFNDLNELTSLTELTQ